MASPTTTPPTDAEHEAEVAKQEEIAEEIAAADAPKTPPATDEPQLVKLRSKDVENYPLTVSVVGSPDLVFENESAIVEVTPQVAEQIKYAPSVEVAE